MSRPEGAVQPTSAREVAVVLGAGPGLGLAVARRFAAAGHPVAVVSRSAERHAAYLAELGGGPAPAAAEVADVLDRDQQLAVLRRIERELGPIGTLYFGPAAMDPGSLPVALDRADGSVVRRALDVVASAADAVAAVLPGMRDRGRGSILLPTGLSAVRTMPELGTLALPSAALRNYALTLNATLADSGVHVASLVIGGGIRGGDIYRAMVQNKLDQLPDGPERTALDRMSLDPDEIADAAYRSTIERGPAELTFSVA